jgi:hypothetical protein
LIDTPLAGAGTDPGNFRQKNSDPRYRNAATGTISSSYDLIKCDEIGLNAAPGLDGRHQEF